MYNGRMTVVDDIAARVAEEGFAFVRGSDGRRALESIGSLADWDDLVESWGRLETDRHMADQGRYRRRRHAVYHASAAGSVERQPHQPHFQAVDYNPLNGGVDRWFEPVEDGVGSGPSLATILDFCRRIFSVLAPAARRWRVEVHQFRIEARLGERGQPTPEGMHRDGVDYVLVLLVERRNIASGTTTVRDAATGATRSFTLTDPFDAVFLDDARVQHGVTPVEPVDPASPAFRDVLVVTFRRV